MTTTKYSYISLHYGKLYLHVQSTGRMRVYFINDDNWYDYPEADAPFLYLPTVTDRLLPLLNEAKNVYLNNVYKQWMQKSLYNEDLYCSNESKRVQLKISLQVLAWEGELHIRLCQDLRNRFNIATSRESVLSVWRPLYGSFRFHINDLDVLKYHFLPLDDQAVNDEGVAVSDLADELQEVCI